MVRMLLGLLTALSLVFSLNLERVSEKVYMVRGGYGLPSKENRGLISNAYAVLTREGWVVIDTLSTPELAREFISELKKVKDAPILYVIVTHYHMDHWFGIAPFKEEGAKFIAHRNLRRFYDRGFADEVLKNAGEAFGVFEGVRLLPPDLVVENRVRLRVGREIFEIIPMTPAHTNSDLVVRVGDLLFVGDLVSYGRIPFLGDRNVSTRRWLGILRRLESMRPGKILMGHGEPADLRAVEWTASYITYVRENVRLLKERGLFVDEIKEALRDTPFKNAAMYEEFHMRNVYSVFNELDTELE